MSERDDLLLSVADTIKTYRAEELPEPTPEHVDRWLSQFTQEQQLPFLREFDHVIKQSFLTEEGFKSELEGLVTCRRLVGNYPTAYWKAANFLDIQRNGHSQKKMLELFAICLEDVCGLDLYECGQSGGDFIYIDDAIFSGNRVCNDLEPWIVKEAPQTAKVHVIVVAQHTGGQFLAERRLKKVVADSGKSIEINYWYSFQIENRKFYKDCSGVLWPAVIPNVEDVLRYIDSPSRFPFECRQPGKVVWPFSSEGGRQVLESEFLIAGAKIWARCDNPKASMRPLGFSPFGVGFGAMTVTYRNCPNNCPLALWWGDPKATSGALQWYPLLPREGYSSSSSDIFDFDAF